MIWIVHPKMNIRPCYIQANLGVNVFLLSDDQKLNKIKKIKINPGSGSEMGVNGFYVF